MCMMRQLISFSPKSNCYAIGVFKTFYEPLQKGNHIVLVNPMDMGNMGTIMRTMLGVWLSGLSYNSSSSRYL